jgi:LuxR family maltose regulon positive regulatory protein
MRASAAGRVAWNGASADYSISEQTREVAVTSAMNFESEVWQAWLERIPSFAFHGRDGQRFTARKETRARGGSYWVAYRTVGGKLTYTYIGRTTDVTLSRLEEVARSFATDAISPVRLRQRSPVFSSRMPAETQWQNQQLSTKFFVPVASHSLVARPRLFALLDEGGQCGLTLVSAPAGFGKTTLLSAWIRSLPLKNPFIAWVSLDGADNHPVRFWISVLAALDRIQPGLCGEFVTYLFMEPNPPLYHVLTACLNALAQALPSLVIVLDDYHVITEEAVHTSLTWFLEHLPSQISLILSTRADPP